MKIKTLIICFFTSALCIQLAAQSNTSNVQVGVSGAGVVTVMDVNALSLGGGKQMNVWVRKMLNKKNGISLNLGFRYLGGLNEESISYTEKVYPTEQVLETELLRLNDLRYLDVGFSWYGQPKRKSAWSYELGIQASYLVDAKGIDFKRGNFTQSYLTLTETMVSGGSIEAIVTPIEQSIDVTSHLNNFDIGLRANVYYQLMPGIQAHAGFYQGFNSVVPEGLFPDTDQKLITSFNLGFTARLF
jgi:hypothetical protein